MLIDLETGNINLDGVIFHKGFTFEEFKKTQLYKNQDEKMVIFLLKTKIDKYEYYTSVYFNSCIISKIYLEVEDERITGFENVPQLKYIHDNILKEYGIIDGKKYSWVTISSVFDPKGCVSSIIIEYQ